MKDIDDTYKKFHITPDDLYVGDVGSYLELDSHQSRLDGLFSADELRRIANAMDFLNSTMPDWFYIGAEVCINNEPPTYNIIEIYENYWVAKDILGDLSTFPLNEVPLTWGPVK